MTGAVHTWWCEMCGKSVDFRHRASMDAFYCSTECFLSSLSADQAPPEADR